MSVLMAEYSPRYVFPRPLGVQAPPAYGSLAFDTPMDYGAPMHWQSRRGGRCEPPRAPLAQPTLSDGRGWFELYPFEGADIFEAIQARSAAEPLKVSGTVGGGLAVTGCHQSKGASVSPSMRASNCGTDDGPSTASTGTHTTDGTESACSASEDVPKKNKKNRFCKGKRDRYRKLVERLIKEARANPDAFDLEAVQLPLAIASSEVSKEKLLATVMKFAKSDTPAEDIN